MTLILPGADITDVLINGLEHGAWTPYVPTLTASAGSAALGNATVLASYHQVGKRVHIAASVTFGGTSTYGTAGILYFALPVLQSAGMAGQVLGGGYLADTSAGARLGAQPIIDGANQRLFLMVPSTGAFVATAAPWTWASTDVIRFSGTYEAA